MQVADFGSARFATQEGYQHAEQHPPERAGSVRGSLESMMVSPSVFLDAISPLGHTEKLFLRMHVKKSLRTNASKGSSGMFVKLPALFQKTRCVERQR